MGLTNICKLQKCVKVHKAKGDCLTDYARSRYIKMLVRICLADMQTQDINPDNNKKYLTLKVT